MEKQDEEPEQIFKVVQREQHKQTESFRKRLAERKHRASSNRFSTPLNFENSL